MQNLISTLSRLAVVLTGALALGACSRAEYAFLPKSASYLGTTTAAPKARVATAPVATPAPVAQAPVAAPAPAVAPEIVIATAPAAPRAAQVAVPTPPARVQAVAAPEAATVATATPHKLSLMQRIVLSKVTRKIDKLAAKLPLLKQYDNTALTARGGIDSKLRYAIIFGAIGLIFLVIGGTLGRLIGTILFIIALLFLLFWLLDNL